MAEITRREVEISVNNEDDEHDIIKYEEPLSPTSRLLHEPGTNTFIVVIFGIKTEINTKIKKELFQSMAVQPRFRSLLVVTDERKRKMKWVQTKVNLDDHMIIPKFNPNMESPDTFIEDYASNLSKTPMDMSKPLWDFHALNLKTSNAQATCILRVHHSIGDGMSLMSLLIASTRKASDPKELPSIPTKSKEKVSSGGVWIKLCKFWSFVLLIWNTLVDILMFAATAMFLKDTKTPLKGPKGVESNPRRFVHRILSLDDVKLVKNAMNVTVNDVVLGVVQAGLSVYLNRKYGERREDQTQAEKNNNLPKNIRLRGTVIINVRRSPGLHALAEMMEKGTKVEWGNKIGYVLLPFTIALQKNPIDYVVDAKVTMDRKKHSLEAILTSIVGIGIVKFLGVKFSSFITRSVPSHTTIFFSNMVGPSEEVVFYGHPVSYIVPSCYGLPTALMIHVQSYADKMIISLAADESTIPNPHQLLDDFETSLKLIKDDVIAKALVKDVFEV